MLVLDASTVFDALQFDRAFRVFRGDELVAPHVMWCEVRSALHESVFRGELSDGDGLDRVHRLEEAPIRPKSHRLLGLTAWQIADQMGWAKTYDAEYVALARLLRCRLVTSDDRLRRGTDRLGFVVGPHEL